MILTHRNKQQAAGGGIEAPDSTNKFNQTTGLVARRRKKRQRSNLLQQWLNRSQNASNKYTLMQVMCTLCLFSYLLRGILMDYNAASELKSTSTAGTLRPRLKKFPAYYLDHEAKDYTEDDTLPDAQYADRHIRRFVKIANDPDCVNPSLSVLHDDFEASKAAALFAKCRLLVLKDAYREEPHNNLDFLSDFRQDFTHFITGLKSGRISTSGTTTTGDSFFFAPRQRSRWEIILPQTLAHPRLVANPAVLSVLRDRRVLGPWMTMRSLQSILAEGGSGDESSAESSQAAVGQEWHYDQNFLWGDQAGFDMHGIAGHDLPPFAVTVGVPMLDKMERSHGPTEFCMGSSALTGLDPNTPPLVRDSTLTDENSLWHEYAQAFQKNACPAKLWRSPLLEFGDVVLFDYTIRHRGGWNESPYMRSILLLIYSQPWFDDVNFGNVVRYEHNPAEDQEDDESDLYEDAEQMLARTRLAIPSEYHSLKNTRTSRDAADKELHAKLEEISHFHPEDSEYLEDFELEHSAADFLISNVDIDFNSSNQDTPELFRNDRFIGTLRMGHSISIRGVFGDVVELRSARTGKVIGRHQLKYRGQLVFTKDMVE